MCVCVCVCVCVTQAAFEAREAALVEAEQLRAENRDFERRLTDFKMEQADKANEIIRMHEQAVRPHPVQSPHAFHCMANAPGHDTKKTRSGRRQK